MRHSCVKKQAFGEYPGYESSPVLVPRGRIIDNRQEFLVLLDLLAQVINAVKVSSIDDPNERDRLTSAHNLANRFFQYALTMLHLCDDKNVENPPPSFRDTKVLDPASIDILTRAAMEAFLVFHYVFYSPLGSQSARRGLLGII
jgi:hypothetical protein